MKPVCLVIGAGAGIGGTVGVKFAAEGYHAVLCRRSDEEGLQKLVGAIEGAGGEATGFLMNATDENAIEERVAQVEAEIGPIDTVIYNLGAQIGNRTLAETPPGTFELGWRLGCFGLYRLARCLFPKMVERGKGTLLVTSSTAAMRGNAGQHSHAASFGGRRMLCQTLNAEFAPQGIHIAHIIVDGSVDAPDTLGKLLGPEKFQQLRDTQGAKDGLLLPEKIAETYYHLAQQHRSVWTHELDVRAHTDIPWFNSSAIARSVASDI